MKRIAIIGHNDLRLFLRSKVAYLWMFAVPLVFIFFMGFAVRGPGDPSNPRPGVLIENADTNFLSRAFLDEIGAQGLRTVDKEHRHEAKRGIRIPADFTDKVLREEPAKIEFFKTEGADESASAMIEVRFYRALIAANAHLIQSALANGGHAQPSEAALREARKAPQPVRLNARFAGRKPMPTGFNFSLPGNLVMYLVMNLLIFGGASVAWQRHSGVLRRLSTHPVRRHELIFGKIYGLMLLGVVQVAFLLLAGRFIFHVNLGANLPAVLVTLVLLAWVAASLGLLIGSLVTADDKVIGLCIIVSLLMAALGGCWWPLEIAPASLRMIAHGLPTGWAMDALHQVITFGGGLAEAKTALGVLVLFGAGANLLAARFFRV